MLTLINCRQLVRTDVIRRLSTTSPSLAKEEKSFESEWSSALPYSKIPGPSRLKAMRSFFPGGKYSGLDMVGTFAKVREEYGQIASFPGNVGRLSVVFAFDPKDIEKVYRTEGSWPLRRGGFETLAYYREHLRPDIFKGMGGLVTDQGEPWANLRFKVNPVMLQPKTVKTYVPDVEAVTRDFLELMRASRDANNEVPETFGQDLNKWALESIAVIALNQRLGVLEEGNAMGQALIFNIKEFLRLTYQLDILPSIWRYVKTPKFYQLMRVFDNITNIISKYVDDGFDVLSRREQSEGGTKEASIMEKLLKINRQMAVVMAMDMLVAGVDTTATAAVGCLYHLATNPDKQEQLREEIRRILPSIDDKLSPDSLKNIPYLRACFKEALRLSPILSGGLRAAGQDLVLQGYQIPKGTDIVIAGTILQREEEHFPQSDRFLPERWLKKDDGQSQCPSARSANPFIYLPFGFGARACIGRRFAEMEVEVLLLRILRQYKVEWNYPPIKYLPGLIQTPTGALKFKITELKE